MEEQKEQLMPLHIDEEDDETGFDFDFEDFLRKRAMDDKKEADKVVSLTRASQIISNACDEEVYSKIFERIESGEISGDADDYHNIAVDYARNQQPERACRICQTGIKKWPDNIDLNADALTYAMDAGLTDEVDGLAELLQKNCPVRSQWNWRGFRFLFMYYINLKPAGYQEAAEQLIKDYKIYLPTDEKAYMCESELYQKQGKTEEALRALETALHGMKAPQCALALSDLYFERADYDDVIRTATLGIAYSAEPQPGIRTAYLLMLRAMAKDALLLQKDKIDPEEAQEVLREYRLAKKYVSLREKSIIDLRVDILKTYACLSDELEDEDEDME